MSVKAFLSNLADTAVSITSNRPQEDDVPHGDPALVVSSATRSTPSPLTNTEALDAAQVLAAMSTSRSDGSDDHHQKDPPTLQQHQILPLSPPSGSAHITSISDETRDKSVIDLINHFQNGNAVGDPSDPDGLKRLFTAYVDKYNYETLMHLQVVGIAFEKSLAPTPDEGTVSGMPLKGMVPVIRIRCGACSIDGATDDANVTSFRERYPLKSTEGFQEPLLNHLNSIGHREKTEVKLTLLSHASRWRQTERGPSWRTKRARSLDDEGSPDRGRTDDLLPTDEDQETLSDRLNRNKRARPDSPTPVHAAEDSDNSDEVEVYGLDKVQMVKLIESRYDVTGIGRTCEQLGKLVVANTYDTYRDQYEASEREEPDEDRGRYEGPPDIRLLPGDGPVTEQSVACSILGLKDPGMPLSGMVYPLTHTQLTAAASIWQTMDKHPIPKGRGFMLCDAVGMGKTCSALTVFIKDIQETASPRRTLILCPGGIQSLVWKAEIDKHTPSLSPHVAVIDDEVDWHRFLGSSPEKKPIVIVTFELLQRAGRTNTQRPKATVNLSSFLAHRLIVDEFQNLRAPRTWLAKICRAYADEPHIKHVLLLSGTPAPCSVSDLYVPLRMINILSVDVTFGPWAKRTRRGRYEQADGLKRELKGTFYMSRTFDFARELQIKGETFNDKKRGCKTYGREWDILKLLRIKLRHLLQQEMDKDSFEMSEYIKQGSPVLEVLEGMRLLSYSFDNFLHWCREKRQELSLDIAALDLAKEAIGAHEVTCKISSVAGFIAGVIKLDPCAKILVVGSDSGFQDPLKEILSEVHGLVQFNGFPTTDEFVTRDMIIYDSRIHDRQAKEAMLIDFLKQDTINVLMGPLSPLSEGKNLQICNHLILLDSPRSPAASVQISGRLLRQGQKRSVKITRFNTLDSPDEMYDNLVNGRMLSLGDLRSPMITYGQLRSLMKLKVTRSRR